MCIVLRKTCGGASSSQPRRDQSAQVDFDEAAGHDAAACFRLVSYVVATSEMSQTARFVCSGEPKVVLEPQQWQAHSMTGRHATIYVAPIIHPRRRHGLGGNCSQSAATWALQFYRRCIIYIESKTKPLTVGILIRPKINDYPSAFQSAANGRLGYILRGQMFTGRTKITNIPWTGRCGAGHSGTGQYGAGRGVARRAGAGGAGGGPGQSGSPKARPLLFVPICRIPNPDLSRARRSGAGRA